MENLNYFSTEYHNLPMVCMGSFYTAQLHKSIHVICCMIYSRAPLTRETPCSPPEIGFLLW